MSNVQHIATPTAKVITDLDARRKLASKPLMQALQASNAKLDADQQAKRDEMETDTKRAYALINEAWRLFSKHNATRFRASQHMDDAVALAKTIDPPK